MQLEGKVAAVTGGTRGIGRGIVEAFLAEGAKVVMNGRSEEKGARALSELNAGDQASFIAGDVTQETTLSGLVDGTVERYGKIDILVNNAGGAGGFAPVAQMENADWDHTIAWNLSSTFWGIKHAFRHMIPQESGRVINISSLEGKHGKPGISAYVASKHAINGLTKSSAQEVGPLGITVNAICPGLIETDILLDSGAEAAASMGLTYEEMVQKFSEESSIKRMNTVEEIGAVATLLASDVGAGITGALWSVDGGTAAY
ncbi:MAG: 3-oxoacyl-ACP reductase [Dehalococcoidia bacterium]|nr:3-oxoacyl-ACP reductase [Dehalococcoidia bacterium]HCV00223.1 3-oxoacyl-ACP reductase [Dehalococcoidia bacterium]|tara:strand:+ start:2966 stop:3742 length:777 start_codon:yes stop_codon:yes gene_type:complete